MKQKQQIELGLFQSILNPSLFQNRQSIFLAPVLVPSIADNAVYLRSLGSTVEPNVRETSVPVVKDR